MVSLIFPGGGRGMVCGEGVGSAAGAGNESGSDISLTSRTRQATRLRHLKTKMVPAIKRRAMAAPIKPKVRVELAINSVAESSPSSVL
eukprot:CAMPEP_0174752986 /NCGR_PEP_ID=MMETSP1094-20130205/103202_1 /TAXON_ID=156173 /ORGANISM="Chrysochromulina brevifilum, Strain UTEX LB 985" /LENGTH=87 /DNA_ID=CAMNT_0015958691 /DNA_START=358 /DNA_END=618 /DNA_ORIENTATION=+